LIILFYFYIKRQERKNDEYTGRLAQQKEQLETTYLELKSFFDCSAEFIFILDRLGIIMQVNPSAVQALGLTENELVGRSIMDFFAPESQDVFIDNIPHLLWKGSHRQELIIITKGGEKYPILKSW